MPEYKYTAISENKDDKISGKILAASKSALAKDLRKKSFFLINAEEIEGTEEIRGSLSFSRKISLLEKVLFTRNLGVMLSSGLSFSRSLQVLSEQAKNKKFKSIILNIRNEVTMGSTLSQSLDNYPDVFSEVYRSMIRLSEEAGTMEDTLKTLTEQLENEYELRSKIKGALVYPAVIVAVMIIIGIIFSTVFIPVIAQTFESMEIELPLLTRIIINSGMWMSENWYLVPVLLILMGYSLKTIIKTEQGKRAVDGFLLKIPIVSTLIRKNNAAFITKTMGALLSSGVPIVKSMEILSRTVSNTFFKESIDDSIKIVERGGKFSRAFLPFSNLYGLMTVQMLEVGEETGQTTNMLFKSADFLKEEVTNLTKNLASILEPILMIFIGFFVGIFAFAIIMPIYSMLSYI